MNQQSSIQRLDRSIRIWPGSSLISEISLNRTSSVKSQNLVKTQEPEQAAYQQQRPERKQQLQLMVAQQNNNTSISHNHSDMVAQIKEEKEQDITDGLQVIDLNRYLFNGMVQLCRLEGLISEEIAHDFLMNHSIGVDKDFISKYRSNQLNKFDFSKCKINIFDYRKLVQMLVEHNPQRYIPLSKPEKPYDFRRQIHQFLKQMYELSDIDYERQRDEQIIKYCQHWWGGPERKDPLLIPTLKFYETQKGQKLRQSQQEAIRIQNPEQENERKKRLLNQRTTNDDLKKIAAQLSRKLFGQIEVKLQSNSKSIYDQSEPVKEKKIKKEKNKKSKKEKKSKKQKKGMQVQMAKKEDDQYQPGTE